MGQPGLSLRRIRPRNSAGRNLKAAIGVGVGLAVLVVAAALVGPYAWYPLVALAVFGATWEVTARLTEAGYLIERWVLYVGGQVMVWSSWFFGVTGIATSFVAVALVLMLTRLFHVGGAQSSPGGYVRDTSVAFFVAA